MLLKLRPPSNAAVCGNLSPGCLAPSGKVLGSIPNAQNLPEPDALMYNAYLLLHDFYPIYCPLG